MTVQSPPQGRPVVPFVAGLIIGILVALAALAGALTTVRREGIRVHVETAPIAAQVEEELRTAIKREVPATLAALRADLPRRVADQTAQRLRETSLNVAGFNVPIPPAAADQVSAGVEQALRSGLAVALTDADLAALADRLSHHAGATLQTRLNTYLANRTFKVDLWPGFSIPVTVVAH